MDGRKGIMTTTIRRAVVGDELALAELNAFVHEFHVAHDPSHFKPASREEVAAWFRRLIGDREARIWIAHEDAGSVGYASVFVRERAENVFCRARRWCGIDQIGVRP
jgi:hypothetical protein